MGCKACKACKASPWGRKPTSVAFKAIVAGHPATVAVGEIAQAIRAAKGPPTSGASVDGNSVEVAIAAGADAETAKIVVAEIGAEMVARTVNGIGSKTATSRGIQEELELNGQIGLLLPAATAGVRPSSMKASV